MSFTVQSTRASFGGQLLKLTHDSRVLNCRMSVNLFLPPTVSSSSHAPSPSDPPSPLFNTPLIFFLGGLTCTADNGAEKGGFHIHAARRGIAICYPDTSPRGLGIAGEDEDYEFGTGAGFYVDATREPWSENYRMQSYVTKELPEQLFAQFTELDPKRMSIMGHSMGGHGALICYLKHPHLYRSCSAFAPIANPSNCDWGRKAFNGYFGAENRDMWAEYDATELVKKHAGRLDVLVDVGTIDEHYLNGQLLPENLVEAAKRRPDAEASGGNGGINLRFHEGYDHSYYSISSLAADHIDHAAKYLV